MKTANPSLLPWLSAALMLVAAPASGEKHASLGVNLGVVSLSTENESEMLVSIPNDVLFGIQPGLRIGFLSEDGVEDFYFDTGLMVVSSSNVWALTANYQRNLTRSATAPYLTVGAGFRTYSDGYGQETGPLVGGGLGVIHRVADDHGTLRLELRLDVLDEPGLSSALESFGVKAGFDVWVR